MPSFDDLMPEIGGDLLDFQEEAGAVFGDGSSPSPSSSSSSSSVPLSYGNNTKALFSIEEDAVVMDVSDWARLRLAGPDAESFLHGQLGVDVEHVQVD